MVRRVSSHELDVRVGHFALRLDSIDGFVNIAALELLPAARVSILRSHGLLGQTWSEKRHKGPLPDIEGVVDDYALTDNDVFVLPLQPLPAGGHRESSCGIQLGAARWSRAGRRVQKEVHEMFTSRTVSVLSAPHEPLIACCAL